MVAAESTDTCVAWQRMGYANRLLNMALAMVNTL